MYLSRLSLENFRSHQKREFDFDPKTNLILGLNGSGKTNILEAIYCLSVGKSFRSSTQSQLLTWNQINTSVRGDVISHKNTSHLEVQYFIDSATMRLKRRFRQNEIVKTRPQYLSSLLCVVFQPEDIRLVNGSPSRRRQYLDEVLQSFDWRYASASSQYNKALKHRNELLDLIRINKANKSELFYWDQSLIKNSEIIHHLRQDFINHQNEFFIKNDHEEIQKLRLQYLPSVITQDHLTNLYDFDLQSGYTHIGPHRDDFSFDNLVFPGKDKNLSAWGSRGQQRLAVLALRLGQIEYIENNKKDTPILLLDDIFSELDPNHQHLVVKLCLKYQTFFTSSEDNTKSNLLGAKVISL